MVVLVPPSTQVAWEGVGLQCQRESSLANEDQDWAWVEAAGREMKEGIAVNSEELEGPVVEQRGRGMTLVIQLVSVKNKNKKPSSLDIICHAKTFKAWAAYRTGGTASELMLT